MNEQQKKAAKNLEQALGECASSGLGVYIWDTGIVSVCPQPFGSSHPEWNSRPGFVCSDLGESIIVKGLLCEGGTGDKTDLDGKAGNRYILGNYFFGSFEGTFSSINEAWEVLSARFLLEFPNPNGTYVVMQVKKLNEFGFLQPIECKRGLTSLKPIPISKLRKIGPSIR